MPPCATCRTVPRLALTVRESERKEEPDRSPPSCVPPFSPWRSGAASTRRSLRSSGEISLQQTGKRSPNCYHSSPMTARESRIKTLHELLAERILVIGGPYGTYLHGRDLTAADYGGAQYEGCPEQLVITRPDVIEDAHRGYLEAGADIITTNTFGGGSIVLAEYGLQDKVLEINEAAAKLSRSVADAHSTPRRPRFVA